MKEKVVLYPVSKEQGIENKTLMSYNIALNANTDFKDLLALDVVTKVLLQTAAAPLKKELLDNKIGDVIEGSFDSDILQPVFSIVTKNTNEEEKEKFVKIIEDSLKKYVKEGLNKKLLLATMNNFEFKIREADSGGLSKGIIYTINSLGTWLYDENNPFSNFDYTDAFNYLKENLENNYFESVIEKYLINNNHKAIVICKPSLEIQETKEKQLKEKLEKYKNSLSNEEIQKIIDDTAALKKYQATPDTKENLDTIPLLKKEDLTLDVLPVINKEEIIDGVKVLHHDYSTNKIAYIKALFNLKNVPSTLYPYLGVFRCLLGSLDTNKYSYDLLEQEVMLKTGGIRETIFTSYKNNVCDKYFSIEGSTLYNNITFTMETFKEIALTTVFDNKNRIQECLAMEMSILQNSLVGAGHVKAMTRALSYTEESSYISDLVEGVGYFNFLSELTKSLDEKYETLINKMNELAEYIFTKENLLLSFTGDSEGYDIFKETVVSFVSNIKDSKETNDKFVFAPNKLNEGFKAPFDVNFVALTGNFKKDNLPYSGSLLVFENAVKTDYLWKEIRVLGGAYGCMCGFGRSGMTYFVSYRDPNIEKTLDTYKNTVKYIDDFNGDEEEMLKLIIGAVGSYDYPKSPVNKGRRALMSYLVGLTEEDYLLEKKQIIGTTIDDIKKVKNYIVSIINQNNICVIGNDKKIDETVNVFDNKKSLF